MPWVFLAVWSFPFLTHVYMPMLNEVVGGSCLIWYNVTTVLQRILILVNALIWFCAIPSLIIVVLYTRMGNYLNIVFV